MTERVPRRVPGSAWSFSPTRLERLVDFSRRHEHPRSARMHFHNQVVWITGASSGIGEALAKEFARKGARLVLSSRRAPELERVRQSCERPEDHRIVPIDLAQAESFPATVRSVLAQCGQVDVLVNNGGIGQRAFALDTKPEVERTIMEIDYFAPVALSKAVLPAMLERRSGHLVIVSSVMGYVGVPGRSSYAAAKHALHGYFDCLRAELWDRGVHITLACPGYVQTNISANALGGSGGTRSAKDPNHARGITAESCAAAIVRAVIRRKREAYIGAQRGGIYLQRIAPGLFARIARKLTIPVHPDR